MYMARKSLATFPKSSSKKIIILLAENDYPPVDRNEVYKKIFEQAANFKKYQKR